MVRILLVVGLVALAFLYLRFGHGSKGQKAPKQKDWLRELRKMTGGDQETIDRLIAAEQKRNPGGHRQQWARAAVKRWEADLR